MIGATIDLAMGRQHKFTNSRTNDLFFSTYVLHTNRSGYLRDIVYDPVVAKKVIKQIMYKHLGDTVESFDGSNKAIGIIFLQYDSEEEMLGMMDNMCDLISVIVE